MKEFSASPSKDVSLFLVCTDRSSRGIDFTRVDHVILFNSLRDLSEYVCCVGRTARGSGGKGEAFVLAVGKHSLARRIMVRNWKGHPLHDLLSAYELMSWDVRAPSAPSGIEFMLGVTGIDPISPFFLPAFYRGMVWQEMKT